MKASTPAEHFTSDEQINERVTSNAINKTHEHTWSSFRILDFDDNGKLMLGEHLNTTTTRIKC